jgi:hypothetical protein
MAFTARQSGDRLAPRNAVVLVAAQVGGANAVVLFATASICCAPRSQDDALVASAESLIRLALVRVG